MLWISARDERAVWREDNTNGVWLACPSRSPSGSESTSDMLFDASFSTATPFPLMVANRWISYHEAVMNSRGKRGREPRPNQNKVHRARQVQHEVTACVGKGHTGVCVGGGVGHIITAYEVHRRDRFTGLAVLYIYVIHAQSGSEISWHYVCMQSVYCLLKRRTPKTGHTTCICMRRTPHADKYRAAQEAKPWASSKTRPKRTLLRMENLPHNQVTQLSLQVLCYREKRQTIFRPPVSRNGNTESRRRKQTEITVIPLTILWGTPYSMR